MAEIGSTYLNSQEVKALSADPSADSFPYLAYIVYAKPVLEYCSLYWGIHAKKELLDHSRSLALHLLQACDDHI